MIFFSKVPYSDKYSSELINLKLLLLELLKQK